MPVYVSPAPHAERITDNFAAHVKRRSVNPGTDYAQRRGVDVVAIAPGTITWTDPDPDGSGGRMIGVTFDTGAYAEYLHLSTIGVRPGARVEQGQVIGTSGGSAYDSESGVGTHLHLTFRPHGRGKANADFEGFVGGADAAPATSGEVGWKGIQEMLAALYGYTGKIDGIPGSGTWSAMQRFLARNWGYTGRVDGKAQLAGLTWKATQRWLAARYGYTGRIDGIPGSGTTQALARAGAANASAY
jgi:murein DD-endopeptidase